MEPISCKQPVASQWDVMWSLIGLKFRRSGVMHTTVRSDVRQQIPKWFQLSNEPFYWICFVSVFLLLLLLWPCDISQLILFSQSFMKWMSFGNDVPSHSKMQTARVEARRTKCSVFFFSISFFAFFKFTVWLGPCAVMKIKKKTEEKRSENKSHKQIDVFLRNTCSLSIRRALLSRLPVNYVSDWALVSTGNWHSTSDLQIAAEMSCWFKGDAVNIIHSRERTERVPISTNTGKNPRKRFS